MDNRKNIYVQLANEVHYKTVIYETSERNKENKLYRILKRWSTATNADSSSTATSADQKGAFPKYIFKTVTVYQ